MNCLNENKAPNATSSSDTIDGLPADDLLTLSVFFMHMNMPVYRRLRSTSTADYDDN